MYRRPFLLAFIITPLLIQASQALLSFIIAPFYARLFFEDVLAWALIITAPGLLASAAIWLRWALRMDAGLVSSRPFAWYLPQTAAFALGLVLWITASVAADLSYINDAWWLLAVDLPYLFMTLAVSFFARMDVFLYVLAAQFIVTVAVPGIALACRRVRYSVDRRMFVSAGAVVILGIGAGVQLWRRSLLYLDAYSAAGGEGVAGEVDLYHFRPFAADNGLPRLSAPTLVIKSDWPKLDGATAAFPVYSAVAQSLYAGLDELTAYEHVTCSNTIGGYERLIQGEADVFFGAQPSEAQRKAAANNAVTLEMTALGREAFVFFVSQDNPVTSLSLKQVREIYTKRITNWSELGGRDEPIMAYQRNKDSGSQTIMEAKVMAGETMAEPIREERVPFMGGIVDNVADYRNGVNAIGYSFRFYVQGMKRNDSLRLLAIEGVDPSVDNIRSGAYPLSIEFFAVTAGTTNPHVPELLEWLQSAQGQQLIEDCGYVGL
jgi:phosphate transport system substrate-binding protein